MILLQRDVKSGQKYGKKEREHSNYSQKRGKRRALVIVLAGLIILNQHKGHGDYHRRSVHDYSDAPF